MTQAPLAGPGDAIGILGGGQLGRMLALAAAKLGLDVHVYAPEADAPAARVAARVWRAGWTDRAALEDFARSTRVVTLEWENIPIPAVEIIAASGTPVFPDARALAATQDRAEEKRFFERIGLTPAPWRTVDRPDGIRAALEELGGRGVLKARRSGYDGKGQARLDLADLDPAAAWTAAGGGPCILEAFIPFRREASALLARSREGAVAAWDVVENHHSEGVLRRSLVPAASGPSVQAEAIGMARRLADSLGYTGVLALELFETADGRLLANEFAPRVHNSGHWTEDACLTGQFEQHIRAVCGWPLGATDRAHDVEMMNILGGEVDDWARLAGEPVSVQLYGKRRAAPGRKMGHFTRLRPKN